MTRDESFQIQYFNIMNYPENMYIRVQEKVEVNLAGMMNDRSIYRTTRSHITQHFPRI